MTADLLRATLAAIARLEANGIRAPRLTQPRLEKWARFRRKLGWRDFIEVLHEDLAGLFPQPFDLARWSTGPRVLDEGEAEALVREAAAPSDLPTPAFLRHYAGALGLPTGGALSELPKVQPRHRVLELPGAGGRIAAHLCLNDDALTFDTQFTFVVDSEAERIAVGLAACELHANEPRIWTPAELERELERGARFDRVFGLKDSARAGALAERFPEARLV